jgi:HlyD family secretion protein
MKYPLPSAATGFLLPLVAVLAAACGNGEPTDRVRASGYVEATEVRVASEVGGRLIELKVTEGTRVSAGDTIGRLDTTNLTLAIERVEAERRQADAQLRLLLAGARPEEIRQAEAQLASAEADVRAVQADVTAARRDLERFEALLRSRSGSQKQRDDAAARVETAEARLKAAEERARAAREALARLRAGARPQEIEAARARVAAIDAQLALLREDLSDAVISAPIAGTVSATIADRGELLAPGTPVVTIADLDGAWANVYVAEPVVPRLRLGQPATVITDAGQRLEGKVSYIAPRAEFTPRNVQTAEERSKLVYRVKISVDNREGILKQGMPVEAELPLDAAPAQSHAAAGEGR